jgi:amino acid transporter
MATAVVVGGIIGSGVFKKPQVVAENVPYFGLASLVWVLGGLLALLGALTLAEVNVLYPKAGGNYVFLREGYGRLAGFLWGWVEFLIIRSAGLAALATIFAESLGDILRNSAFQESFGWHLGSDPLTFWPRQWVTVLAILVLAAVNVLGVRWGGLLQLFITIIKIGSLVGIALLPFLVAALARPGSQAPAPQVSNLQPVLPSWGLLDLSRLGTALLGVLWAYHGWMDLAPVAEEIKDPRRNIPRSLLSGVAIVITLYLGANLGYCLIIPQDQMAEIRDTTVATEFSLRLLGSLGAAAASAAVMCSVFGALNGNLLVGPRVLYAMGEDDLAPRVLGAVHPRFHTPALSITVMGLWSALLVVAGAALTRYGLPILTLGSLNLDLNLPAGKPLFDVMTDFAMFGAVIFETLAVATIFVFRHRLPNVERAYRCWGYPYVPALYIAIMILVAANMFWKQRTEALVGMAFIGVGTAVYYFWTRTHPLKKC